MKLNSTAAGLIPFSLFLFASSARAQTAPVSQLFWSSNLSPVGLGGGLEVKPGQVDVRSPALVDPTASNPPGYRWENQCTSFSLSDYTSLAQTMQNLHVNAWAEYMSSSIMGDYSSCHAWQGNTRQWEVDAVRTWTAYIPQPTLTKAALADLKNATNFESVYGDYAVTGITYRRLIRIKFQAQVESSMSSSQISAAISGSYGCFSAGATASDTWSQLSGFSSVNVTIDAEGDPNSGYSNSVGGPGGLGSLQKEVTNDLKHWDSAPPGPDPNQAGDIDTVYLTPYSAMPPGPIVAPQPSPDQVKLQAAEAEYVYLKNAIGRLSVIQANDTNINSQLRQYLFGKADSHGVHVAGTGKLDEANSDLVREKSYMKAHAAGGAPTDPEIRFSFQDPDVVQWRVVNSLYYPHKSVGAVPSTVVIEIYSNAGVTPQIAQVTDAGDYTTRWFSALAFATTVNGVQYQKDSGIQLSYDASFTQSYLDPATGIPHRYAFFEWEQPGPETVDFQLFDSSGNQFYNAVDWGGNPTPMLQLNLCSFLPNN